MNKTNLQNYVDIVKSNIEKNLNTITSIVYKYDVKSLFKQLKDLSQEEQDKIIENCINDCLYKIQNNSFDNQLLNKVERDIDEILDFYDNDEYSEIIEEASEVSFDLIKKATGFHNIIKEKDIQLTTIFILLYLSSFIYCLDHNNYNEN